MMKTVTFWQAGRIKGSDILWSHEQSFDLIVLNGFLTLGGTEAP